MNAVAYAAHRLGAIYKRRRNDILGAGEDAIPRRAILQHSGRVASALEERLAGIDVARGPERPAGRIDGIGNGQLTSLN